MRFWDLLKLITLIFLVKVMKSLKSLSMKVLYWYVFIVIRYSQFAVFIRGRFMCTSDLYEWAHADGWTWTKKCGEWGQYLLLCWTTCLRWRQESTFFETVELNPWTDMYEQTGRGRGDLFFLRVLGMQIHITLKYLNLKTFLTYDPREPFSFLKANFLQKLSKTQF